MMFDWELCSLSVVDQDKSLMKVQVECSILVVRNCGYYLGRTATCAIWNTRFEIY